MEHSAMWDLPSRMSLPLHPGYGDAILLRPVGHRLGRNDDRPLVGAVLLHAIAVLLPSFPGRAEAVGRELPGALALGSGLVHWLARHGAVGREDHLELDVGGRRGGE